MQDIARASATCGCGCTLNGEVDDMGTSLYPAMISIATPTSGGRAYSSAVSAASDSAAIPSGSDVMATNEDSNVEEIESTDVKVSAPTFFEKV